MSGFEKRLKDELEALLERPDPRAGLSVYHNMPYALFPYEPSEEFELRRQVTLLETRLSQRGKRITRISLSECLAAAMQSQYSMQEWFAVERAQGTAAVVDTVSAVLAEQKPLVELVAERMPPDADPLRDIVFILRAGALFPMYRTSALLEQLQGRVNAPTILFYPGRREGAAGLSFMGVLEPEHNYRPKIF